MAALPAFAGGVVNLHPRLDVVHIHVEGNPVPFVLHGEGLHLHAAGHQVVPLKKGRHPVEHVVACFLDIVRHQVLKGEHPLHVQVAGAGDEVFLVGVLPGQLEADKVAAVVQGASIHKAVLRLDPAGGVHTADALPGLGGHQILTDAGVGRAAAAQGIQGAVRLKGFPGKILQRELRLVAVQLHIGLPRVGGKLLQGNLGGAGRLRSPRGQLPLAACQHQGQAQQQGQTGQQAFFHGR